MCIVETGSVVPQQSCEFPRTRHERTNSSWLCAGDRTAYVMCKAGLTHMDAFNFVQSRRFCIAPRLEFQHQIDVSRHSYAVEGTPAESVGQLGLRTDIQGAQDDGRRCGSARGSTGDETITRRRRRGRHGRISRLHTVRSPFHTA